MAIAAYSAIGPAHAGSTRAARAVCPHGSPLAPALQCTTDFPRIPRAAGVADSARPPQTRTSLARRCTPRTNNRNPTREQGTTTNPTTDPKHGDTMGSHHQQRHLLPRITHIRINPGTADARQRELLSQCACIPWPEIAAEAKAPVISAGPLRHNCIPRTDKNLSFTTHQ